MFPQESKLITTNIRAYIVTINIYNRLSNRWVFDDNSYVPTYSPTFKQQYILFVVLQFWNFLSPCGALWVVVCPNLTWKMNSVTFKPHPSDLK